MDLVKSTDIRDEQLSIIYEFNLKITRLDKFCKNSVESYLTNEYQLKFLGTTLAEIISCTTRKLSKFNKSSEIMNLIREKINSIICEFTQNYPDIPNKLSEFSDEAIKPNSIILQTNSVDNNNNNNTERCFNLIKNPMLIPSCDKDETPIISYQFEYNPKFKVNNPNNERKTNPKNTKRKVKTGIQEFYLILNFGFGKSPKGIILKCFDGFCNFKSYDRDIFKSHYENFHVTTKLKGVCGSCEQDLVIKNVAEEIDHIYNSHSNKTPKLKKDETNKSNDVVIFSNVLLTDVSDVKPVLDSNVNTLVDPNLNTLVDSDKIDEIPIITEPAIIEENSLMNQDTDMSSTTQITIEIKKKLESVETIPIIPEPANAEDKSLLNQDTNMSFSQLIKSLITNESETQGVNTSFSQLIESLITNESETQIKTSPSSLNGVPDSSSNSFQNDTALVGTIPNLITEKGNKMKTNSKSRRKRSSDTIDLEVVLKKYKIDKNILEKPTATLPSMIKMPECKVVIEKLSEEFIKSYRNEWLSTEAEKTIEHKSTSKHEHESIKMKHPKQLSHKSIKIAKKVEPTSFKRSLSLKLPELIKNQSLKPDDTTQFKIMPLIIILKKCDDIDNINGSNSHKLQDKTKFKSQTSVLQSGDEIRSQNKIKESVAASESPKITQIKQVTNTNTNYKMISHTKLIDKPLSTPSSPTIDSKKISKHSLTDKSLIQNNDSKTIQDKPKITKIDFIQLPTNKLIDINLKVVNVSSRGKIVDIGEHSTSKISDNNVTLKSNNKGESSETAVVKLNEPLITKIAQSPTRVYGKFIITEVVPESPLKTNDKQLPTVTDSMLKDTSICRLSKELDSPQNAKSQSESPTNVNLPKINHINFSLLQPWLKPRLHFKYDISCRTQLQTNGLLAIYKCMGFTCSFYTCDKRLFKHHLTKHKEHVIDAHDTFLFCSYCLYKTKEIDNLIDHVTIGHRFDCYQCPYCFYRSCEMQSCATHVTTHHQFQQKYVMSCPINEEPIDVDELTNKLQMNRLKYVAPLRCAITACDKSFYLVEDFMQHMNKHVFNDRNEIKVMQKLFDDHHYGLHQCLYCVYGTRSEDEIRVHLSNCHPSEYNYYCKRESLFKNITSSESLDSTQLIKLSNQNVSIVNFENNVKELVNKENWWKFNDKQHMKPHFTSPNPSEGSIEIL